MPAPTAAELATRQDASDQRLIACCADGHGPMQRMADMMAPGWAEPV